MPVAIRVVDVPLPEGVEPTEEELELLRASLQAALLLRYERGHAFEVVKRKLEAEGWRVSASLGWCAQASRGRDSERALGRTRDEAFEELYQLTRLDGVLGGTP